jgi:hypothetical protein
LSGFKEVVMWVKVSVGPGAVGSERVVSVPTSGGEGEDVIVHAGLVKDSRLQVGEVRSGKDAVLVELPHESVRGNWRLWVPRSAIA